MVMVIDGDGDEVDVKLLLRIDDVQQLLRIS